MKKSTPIPDSMCQSSFDFSEPASPKKPLSTYQKCRQANYVPQPDHVNRKYPVGYGVGSKLNIIFHSMHSRCLRPKDASYSNYGGRGISICPEWLHNYRAFMEWALANGFSDGLSLDRIANDKGYSPENCRFVTMREQCNNRRSNALLTAWGETKTLTEWSRDSRCTVYPELIQWRLKKGMEPEQAISKGTNFHTITAWGETKTIREWSNDPRCPVSENTLRSRFQHWHTDGETMVGSAVKVYTPSPD